MSITLMESLVRVMDEGGGVRKMEDEELGGGCIVERALERRRRVHGVNQRLSSYQLEVIASSCDSRCSIGEWRFTEGIQDTAMDVLAHVVLRHLASCAEQ